MNTNLDYKNYFLENLEYQPKLFKDFFLSISNKSNLFDLIRDYLKNDEDKICKLFVVIDNLVSVRDFLLAFEKFRQPHLKVAEDNMKIRKEGSLGSGGYDTDILRFLLEKVRSFRIYLDKEISIKEGLFKKGSFFWNDSKNVNYFYNKPADYRIVERLNNVENNSDKKALDLGCGGGRHTEMLVNMGFDTYAVDINTEMIEITKRRTGIDNKINYGEILNIPHEDNFFDVVVTTGVLHQAKNLIEYKKAILELERICKNGAVVCLNIFTNDLFDESYIHKNQEDYNEVETKEGLLMYLISKEDFVEIMKQSGFVLENYQLDFVNENTGQRAVFRANFIKK